MPRQITAFSNPLVKQVRGLREKKHRRAERLFIAEGLRILTDARESGRLPAILFYAAGARHQLLGALIEETEAAGGDVVETSAEILGKLTAKDNPQTVIGVFPQFDTALAALDRDAAPLWIVAQALRDPGNLGTILRTGDAVGAGGLILVDDCADPFSVEAVRASMGLCSPSRSPAAAWEEFSPWLRRPASWSGTSLATHTDYQEPRYGAPASSWGQRASRAAGICEAMRLLVKMPMLARPTASMPRSRRRMCYEVSTSGGRRTAAENIVARVALCASAMSSQLATQGSRRPRETSCRNGRHGFCSHHGGLAQIRPWPVGRTLAAGAASAEQSASLASTIARCSIRFGQDVQRSRRHKRGMTYSRTP
jgi:TrmH family RNA methyltransferase